MNKMTQDNRGLSPADIKKLLTDQLQLVSKESQGAHGDTLANLTEALACLSNALRSYIG